MNRQQALAHALRRIAGDASLVEQQSVADELGLPFDHVDVEEVMSQISLVRLALEARATKLEAKRAPA